MTLEVSRLCMSNRYVPLAFLALCSSAACVVPPPAQSPPPAYAAPAPAQPVYAPTPHPAQGMQLGNANWGHAVTQAPLPTPQRQVAPSQVSTDGIVAPMAFRNVEQTGFRVAYGPTQNYAGIQKAFQDAQVFEQFAELMNRILVMPRVLNIQMAECGVVNAFYDPANSRIIMCYEMVAHIFKTFATTTQNQEQLGKAGVYASLFIFFHEFGHALRDILDLPVTGREEDAVDQFSTTLLIDAEAQDAVLVGAQFFGLESARHNDTETARLPFWDEHSLEQQRFYNILCLLYGSNPTAYQGLVNTSLPEARARRCPAEYKNIDAAWTRLLAPHLTQEARIALQNGTQLSTQPAAPMPVSLPVATSPAPVPQGQVSCEMVAQKVVQLVMYEARQLAAAEQQAVQQQLGQMQQLVIQTCYSESWSAAGKQCAMDSSSLAAAQNCD